MRMKNRLTLTIDPVIARKAKRAAKNKNKSLSALVEGLLSGVVGDDSESKPSIPFSRRWHGKLSLDRKADSRFDHLAKKYDL
jgi:hypothetical protein